MQLVKHVLNLHHLKNIEYVKLMIEENYSNNQIIDLSAASP